MKTGFTQVFAKTFTTLGFRYRIVRDKFLVFGVKILPQTNASPIFKIIKYTAQFITINNK